MEQRFSDLIILLASGINQRRLYFDEHPKVRAFSQDFTLQLRKLIADAHDGSFSFGVFQGKFVRNSQYLVGPSIAGRSLIAFAENLGCGGFTFIWPIEPSDVVTFFRLAATTKERLPDLESSRRLFEREGIGHIILANPFAEGKDGIIREGEPSPDNLPEEDPKSRAVDFAPLMDIYQALYEIVSRNSAQTIRGELLDIAGAMTTGERLVQATGSGVMDVMQFIRYPDYDSYTIGHSVRVAALAVVVARRLGLPDEIATSLATAGLLHDLGKGKIPEDILFKPGKLDEEERRIMQSHPALGAQVLIASGEANEIIVTAAWGHHIRQDGRGYPAMPPWHKPGIAATIVHVCDVFEALTAARPYKQPMVPQQAYQIMFKDRAAFDPRPLSALVQALGLYPPGSEVLLTDGSRGVVALPGKDLDNPAVRITHDPQGHALADAVRTLVHLEQEDQLEISDILLVGIVQNGEVVLGA